jgi:hypothetical protein
MKTLYIDGPFLPGLRLNRFDDTNIRRFYGGWQTSSLQFYHAKAAKRNTKALLVLGFKRNLT